MLSKSRKEIKTFIASSVIYLIIQVNYIELKQFLFLFFFLITRALIFQFLLLRYYNQRQPYYIDNDINLHYLFLNSSNSTKVCIIVFSSINFCLIYRDQFFIYFILIFNLRIIYLERLLYFINL